MHPKFANGSLGRGSGRPSPGTPAPENTLATCGCPQFQKIRGRAKKVAWVWRPSGATGSPPTDAPFTLQTATEEFGPPNSKNPVAATAIRAAYPRATILAYTAAPRRLAISISSWQRPRCAFVGEEPASAPRAASQKASEASPASQAKAGHGYCVRSSADSLRSTRTWQLGSFRPLGPLSRRPKWFRRRRRCRSFDRRRGVGCGSHIRSSRAISPGCRDSERTSGAARAAPSL